MTLLGDDLATALTEEMAWYEKFKALCVKNGTQIHLLPRDGETSTKVTANVWKCEVDWSRVRSNRQGLTATLLEHHH